MTTQPSPEPSSHDAQDRAFRHLLRITTLLRKQELQQQQQELQQGMVICGGSGIGKTIAVGVLFSTEDEKDKEEVTRSSHREKGRTK